MLDPYQDWLGIPGDQRPPTYYQLLDLAPAETDPRVIEEAAIRRTAQIRRYQIAHTQECTALLNEIGRALDTLLDPGRRRDYDASIGMTAIRKPKTKSRPVLKPAAESIPAGPDGLPAMTAVALVEPIPAKDALVFDGAEPDGRRTRWRNRTSPGAVAGMILLGVVGTLVLVLSGIGAVLAWRLGWIGPGEERPVMKAPLGPMAEANGTGRSESPQRETTRPGDRASVKATRRNPEPGSPRPPDAKPPSLPLPPDPGPGPAEVPAPEKPPERVPVPNAAAHEKVRERIRDLHRGEYARARPAELKALAGKLLRQGTEAKEDPLERYVSWTEARDLAVEAGDASLAMSITDELARHFLVDTLEMKATALTSLCQSATLPAVHRMLGDELLVVVTAAVRSENWDLADRLIALAEQEAKRSAYRPLSTRVAARALVCQEIRRQLPQVRLAREMLEKKPEEPQANLILGRFFCFLQGDWIRGLPQLAMSGDEVLQPLARQDLDQPREVPAQIELGDTWWGIGEKEAEPYRLQVQRRAHFWYEQAAPGVFGKTQMRIDPRLRAAIDLWPDLKLPEMVGVIRRIEVPGPAVLSVAFSTDGKRVLSGGEDKVARLWDVESGKELRRYLGHGGKVQGVAFSPDGRRILSGSADRSFRLWDAETGRELRRQSVPGTGEITGVAWSPDGRLALMSCDNLTLAWDVVNWRPYQTYLVVEDGGRRVQGATGVAYAPPAAGRGAVVLTSSGPWLGDEIVRLWDCQTGLPLVRLEGHAGKVTSVALSLDGQLAVSGSEDKTVRLWELGANREMRILEGHTARVATVALSPDSQRVLSAGDDKTVRLWQVATGKELCCLEGHTARVTSVAFSRDGRRAVTGSADRSIRIWHLPK